MSDIGMYDTPDAVRNAVRDVNVDCQLLDESGLLDVSAYRAAAGLDPGVNAAEHYLLRGWRQKLEPNPQFEGGFLYPYYRSAGLDGPPALTFLMLQAAGWPVYATRAHAEEAAMAIFSSGFFDPVSYAARAGSLDDLDPAVHYVLIGEHLGLAPSTGFDPEYYRERYPDVFDAAINRLGHYLAYGASEGRRRTSIAETLTFARRRLEASRETILVIVAERSRGRASTLAYDIALQLKQKYNLVAVLLAGGEMLHEFQTCCAAVVGPVPQVGSHEVEAKHLVKHLCACYRPRFAIASGTEAAVVLPALAHAQVPVVTLVHEDASSDELAGSLGPAVDWSTHVVFPTSLVAASAQRAHPALRGRAVHVLSPGARPASSATGAREATHDGTAPAQVVEPMACQRALDQYVCRLEELGIDAARIVQQRKEDFATLRDDPLFDASFYARPLRPAPTRDEAINGFLVGWLGVGLLRRSSWHGLFRRPCAGFHPQIYAHHHRDRYDTALVNPLAHFIRSGRPKGDWWHDVIVPRIDERPARVGGQLKVALHGHFFYPELAVDFLRKLSVNQSQCDLLLTTDDQRKAQIVDEAARGYDRGKVLIRLVPNRGRDIGPLITAFSADELEDYDVVGHFHGKRSVGIGEQAMGDSWRECLWQHLIGDCHPMMDLVLGRFADDQQLGMVFPDDPRLPDWDDNEDLAVGLATRMGIEKPLPPFFDFPIGTMFWARTKALRPLLALGLDWSDYPMEPVPRDGTILHAVERLLPFVARHTGYRYATTHVPGAAR